MFGRSRPNQDSSLVLPGPLTNDPEEDIENLLPVLSVILNDFPQPAKRDVFAFRLVIRGTWTKEELGCKKLIAATPLTIVFQEPKDECDWDGVSDSQHNQESTTATSGTTVQRC